MRTLTLQEMEHIPEHPKETQSLLRMSYWFWRMNSQGKRAVLANDRNQVMLHCLIELAKNKPGVTFLYDNSFFTSTLKKGKAMNALILPTKELEQVLNVCREYGKGSQGMICYKWISKTYLDKYKTSFHQSLLHRLAKLGYLTVENAVRGGTRRYYTVVEGK